MLVTTASAFIRVFFGYFIDVGTLSIRSTSSYFHPLRNRTDGTKLTACTARLLLSAAHQASLPAGKLGAVGRAITSLARPFFRLPCASPLARSARRQILSCRQSHCIIHTPIIPPTMRKPSSAFRPPANSKLSAKPLHHSRAHYSAYHVNPSSAFARHKTEADCTKLNRLYGKALAIRCTFS